MIAVRRKKGEPPPAPEVIEFKELGFLSKQEKDTGEARSRVDPDKRFDKRGEESFKAFRQQAREKKVENKAKELHQQKYDEGNAWADTAQDFKLKDIGKEVMEAGISTMTGGLRNTALRFYRRKYGTGDKLSRKKEKEQYVPYPEYQKQKEEERERSWLTHEAMLDGDERAKVRKRKVRTNVEREDDAMWRNYRLRPGHVNKNKVGKYRDGVLKISYKDFREIKSGKLNF